MSEQLVEQIARAMYAAYPIKVPSLALAELTGLKIGEVIDWDLAVKTGWDFSPLIAHARKMQPLLESAKVEGFLLGIDAAVKRCKERAEQLSTADDCALEASTAWECVINVDALKDRAAQIAGGSNAD